MNPMRQQLLPPYARGVPEPVAAADTAAEEATVAVEAAAAAMGEAERAAKSARAEDTAAATAAVKQGKSAPKATEPAKREALERAQRTFKALKDEAEEAMRVRDREVSKALGEDTWLEEQHEAVDELVAEIDTLAEGLSAAFGRLADQGAILDTLYRRRELAREGRIPKTANLGRWDRRRALGRAGRRQRPDGSFESFGEPVRPDPDSLVAALSTVARALVAERDAPEPTPEEIQRREDIQRTRKEWRQMAEGGVYVSPHGGGIQ